jgi:hypothetical protein
VALPLAEAIARARDEVLTDCKTPEQYEAILGFADWVRRVFEVLFEPGAQNYELNFTHVDHACGQLDRYFREINPIQLPEGMMRLIGAFRQSIKRGFFDGQIEWGYIVELRGVQASKNCEKFRDIWPSLGSNFSPKLLLDRRRRFREKFYRMRGRARNLGAACERTRRHDGRQAGYRED